MPKTIEIRIPVLVADDGDWCAYGYPDFVRNGEDWSVHYDVIGNLNDRTPDATREVWVTATVPLPENEPTEVGGVTE